ncbi:MAG TPA: penicillin-binding transpeptidase domain-containing protein [Terracidiphilus sp.]|nr:penicillin-binding transpeptidase domain-containing protein [Terracidiphilus sp.]
MPHTFRVYGILRSIAIAVVWGALSAAGSPGSVPGWQTAVEHAARVAPKARILVLDLGTGRLLASHRLSEAARTLAAPGSTLKPLVLYGLVAGGRWNPDRRIACDRKLVVATHRLSCTHPSAPPFDAREALTWSCNTYFALMARTFEPGDLGHLLHPTGLLNVTGLAGKSESAEAAAEFHEPMNPKAAQLALLGVEGIRITPLELATAYRWLALELAAHPTSTTARVVRSGIEDSASFGMARQAGLGGVPIAGKTGTADGAASSQFHGWFAGIAPAEKPQVVVVVYLPAGRGADAAHVAAELFAHAPLVHASPRLP